MRSSTSSYASLYVLVSHREAPCVVRVGRGAEPCGRPERDKLVQAAQRSALCGVAPGVLHGVESIVSVARNFKYFRGLLPVCQGYCQACGVQFGNVAL